jgi:DNA-binding XRE family transcriptional regulator
MAFMVNPLRQWRAKVGIAQVELARGVDVPQSVVSSIESGNGCHGDTLARLLWFSQEYQPERRKRPIPLDLLDLVSDRERAKRIGLRDCA